jgi:hypothetical protein
VSRNASGANPDRRRAIPRSAATDGTNRSPATGPSSSAATSSTPTTSGADADDDFGICGFYGISVFAAVGTVDQQWIAANKHRPA